MTKASSPIQIISAFVGLFLLFSAVALINTATANESGTRSNSISHTPNDIAVSTATYSTAETNLTEYVSPEFTAEFPFNGVGLTWSGAQTANVQFALRVDNGDWQNLEIQGEDAKDAVEYFTTAPLFAHGQRLHYRITGPDVALVRNVRVTYFDSTTAPQRSLLSTISGTLKHSAQTDSPTIISREDWGADPAYLTWEPDYSTPKKIIIHHTAGGSGGDDPAATIRGLYYWHSVVLGWGDIGYNYLIDQQGNIYEGRSGGTGAIGAHTYNDYTDTNYNVGSVGISLLGCFETADGACNTVAEYTETINTALTDLISAIANTAEFDPAGEKKWHGEKLPNVIGHQDVDYTYCPGASVYTELDTIRTAASSKYALLQSTQQAKHAQWQSADVATTYTGSTAPTVTITYTNTGTTTWQPSNTVMQLSIKETGKHQRVELLDVVTTNNTTTVSTAVSILPKRSGTYTLVSKLYRKGEVIPGSTHNYVITVTAAYEAADTTLTLPLAIVAGWAPTLNFEATNSGSQAWPAGTTLIINDVVVKTLKQTIQPAGRLSLSLPYTEAAQFTTGTTTIKAQLHTPAGEQIAGSRVIQSLRVD